MNKVTTLSKAIKINSRFQRSVQLLQDWKAQHGIKEYLLSPTAESITRQLVEEAFHRKQHAWSLTGPYGTGKSAFALFLTDMLANSTPMHAKAKTLRQELGLKSKKLLPILLVGQRESIKRELLLALASSMRKLDQDFAKQAKNASRRKTVSPREVAILFKQAGEISRKHKFAGILLIVDEFGKFLEYAAEHGDEDLFVMQEIGETAARSDLTFLVMTILHSAFADYLSGVDHIRRAEWQKVQGRYADIAFLEPPEQFLKLMGSAISFDEEHTNLKNALEAQIANMLLSSGFDEARQRFPLEELLLACAPLHPLTALILWPLFRSTLSQNERSLFAFLSDGSPYGFLQFLTTTLVGENGPDLFQLDALYDYLTSSLGDALLIGLNARRWAEISNALVRLPADAPEYSAAIIKVVGILSIFGATMGLKASDEVIRLAFTDINDEVIAESLTYLETASILVFRRYENAFGLWEGSDVDLDASYALARKQVSEGQHAHRLKKLIELRPFVARGHYVRTGTLRYFQVMVVDGEAETIQNGIGELHQNGNGHVVFVLSRSQRQRRKLIQLVKELAKDATLSSPLSIWAFPKPLTQLEQLITELECWRWVQANIPELQGDPVARAEVRAHVQLSRQQLLDAAGESLGLRGYVFKPYSSEWIYQGASFEFKSSIEFQKWLSSLCDDVYEEAPELLNELLNREALSSAAAAARRNLVEAMLAYGSHETLGIEGFPAEYSMYRSMLRSGGFHRRRNGRWSIGTPRSEWKPVWKAMIRFLQTTRKGRLPISELTHLLQQPPFGIRGGPIPILQCALVLAHRDTIALYEEGVLVPELRIEVLERLMRVPERFEMQWYQFVGEDRKTLEILQSTLTDLPLSGRGREQVLLAIVKSMILFLAHLPPYSQTTRRLSPIEAMDVRTELSRAGDPYQLVFETLPSVLGIDDLDKQADVYAEKLHRCLQALVRAYPSLLDQIENSLRDVFSLNGSAREARDQLIRRAEPLIGRSSDATLSLFVKELQSMKGRDWREVLGRIVNKGTPTHAWRDRDLVDFQVNIKQVAADFLRLEELVAERGLAETSTIFRIGLLDGHLEEQRALVAISDENQDVVDALATEIGQMLNGTESKSSEARKIRIAALAKAAAQLIAEQEEEQDTHE